VTANNLANVSTAGLRARGRNLGDLFASTQSGVSATAVGNGARSRKSPTIHQGNNRDDGQQLDLAISAMGPLRARGALSLTRDGQSRLLPRRLDVALGEFVGRLPETLTPLPTAVALTPL